MSSGSLTAPLVCMLPLLYGSLLFPSTNSRMISLKPHNKSLLWGCADVGLRVSTGMASRCGGRTGAGLCWSSVPPQRCSAPTPSCAAPGSSAPEPGVLLVVLLLVLIMLVPAAICSSTTARGAAEVRRHLGGNPPPHYFHGLPHCKGQASPKYWNGKSVFCNLPSKFIWDLNSNSYQCWRLLQSTVAILDEIGAWLSLIEQQCSCAASPFWVNSSAEQKDGRRACHSLEGTATAMDAVLFHKENWRWVPFRSSTRSVNQ